jgi:hypothetical protein
MSDSPQEGPAAGRGALYRFWAWCRRNPAVAGLLACFVVFMVFATATNTLLFARLAEAQRENEELRRELESLRKAAPPRAVP